VGEWRVFSFEEVEIACPADWIQSDSSIKTAFGDIVNYRQRIEPPGEGGRIHAAIEVAPNVPGGGLEERRREAELFFGRAEAGANVEFEYVRVNQVDFLKETLAWSSEGGEGRQILLAAVENDKRYDIWVSVDPLSQDDADLIDSILGSVRIRELKN
jgi:hypothetical protein